MDLPLYPGATRWCGEIEVLVASSTWSADAASAGLPPGSQLVGLDEAGRGPLAGPVVAAACAIPWPCPDALLKLDDSKRLSQTTRETLFDAVLAHAIGFGIAIVEPSVIDTVNILRASLWGMAVAWDQAVTMRPALRGAIALTDGKTLAPLPPEVLQQALIKGDGRSRNIAAASILAKVTRDRIMVNYDAKYPAYGFAGHKGYPTKAHFAALAEHGPCAIHRRSFRLGGPKSDKTTDG